MDHSVIETRGWAHLTQTTNQHIRIIVKLSSHAPSNHLEHLSNTSHRLPLKEIKGISQDRSVIETWGWARLTRAASSQSWITSTLTCHALATIVEHLSNQNSQRNIFHSECHRGVGVGLYHSYWQEAFGVSWLLAAKPLPSNQTEYLATVCKTYISASEHRIEMGVGLYIHTDFGASWLAAAKPLPSNQTEYP